MLTDQESMSRTYTPFRTPHAVESFDVLEITKHEAWSLLAFYVLNRGKRRLSDGGVLSMIALGFRLVGES